MKGILTLLVVMAALGGCATAKPAVWRSTLHNDPQRSNVESMQSVTRVSSVSGPP